MTEADGGHYNLFKSGRKQTTVGPSSSAPRMDTDSGRRWAMSVLRALDTVVFCQHSLKVSNLEYRRLVLLDSLRLPFLTSLYSIPILLEFGLFFALTNEGNGVTKRWFTKQTLFTSSKFEILNRIYNKYVNYMNSQIASLISTYIRLQTVDLD